MFRSKADFKGICHARLNLCAVMINCDDYSSELGEMFERDDGVLRGDDLKLMDLYKISESETDNMSIEKVIIDRITKLAVDY